MLSTSLLLAALASVPLPTLHDGAPAVEVELTISDTRVAATNATDSPKLLVIRGEDRRVAARVVLAARETVTLEGPARDVCATRVEVVARTGEGLVRSHAVDLGDACAGGVERIEFERRGASYAAFGSRAPSRGPEPTGGDPSRCTAPAPPPHVPVINPTDGRPGDLPPKLERTPLPPV
jgi:hypothetical protein